jgi:hypothetical protein
MLFAKNRFNLPQLSDWLLKSGDWGDEPMTAVSAAVGAMPPFQFAPSAGFVLTEPFHVMSAAQGADATRQAAAHAKIFKPHFLTRGTS